MGQSTASSPAKLPTTTNSQPTYLQAARSLIVHANDKNSPAKLNTTTNLQLSSPPAINNPAELTSTNSQPASPQATNSFKVMDYNDEAIINGSIQDLFQVKEEQYSQQLHKFIGVLLAENEKLPGAIIKGSGILISSNVVLTSAHNIWCHQVNYRNINFKFYPAQRGPLINPYQCSVIFYPNQHETDRQPLYDYALLKLAKPYEGEKNFIPLTNSISKNLNEVQRKKLAIYGYPSLKYNQYDNYGEIFAVSQWGLARTGEVVKVAETETEFFHQMSTLPGQSGCPIIQIGPNRSLTIVGIHKGASKVEINGQILKFNVGRIITQDLIDTLESQVNKCEAEMFKKIIVGRQDWKELIVSKFNKEWRESLNGSQIQTMCYNLSLSQLKGYAKKVAEAITFHYLSSNNLEQPLEVYLAGNNLGKEGCLHLKKVQWQHLSILSLDNNNIGNEGCKHLREAKWQELTFLRLYKNNIGNEGCRHLSQGKWPHLSKLHLGCNEVDAVGFEHLSTAQHWKNSLQKLWLGFNKISRKDAKNILKNLPWVVM